MAAGSSKRWRITYRIQGRDRSREPFQLTLRELPGDQPEQADRHGRRILRRNLPGVAWIRLRRIQRDRKAEARLAVGY